MGSIQTSPNHPSRKPRLMVIDDEPSSVKVVCKHLRDAGYDDVITSTDSSKVMGLVASERPDLLLLDIMMPGISGLDLLQQIRADERFHSLSVIILTASTELHVKARALALGVTDFLHKPIDPTELIPRVHNALSVTSLCRQCEDLATTTADVDFAADLANVDEDADGVMKPLSSEAMQFHTFKESCPSWLSWPVLRRTWFRELKSTAKVMIVDDEPVNIKVVRKYLSTDGYKKFITTTNASDAYGLIESEEPDIILLDIMMPHVSGLDILERIRSNERLMDLPVIILTAATDRATKQRALDMGATEFLTKPVDPTETLPRVRNSLVIKLHQDYIKDYSRRLEQEVTRHLDKVRDYTGVLERTNAALRRSRAAAHASNRAKGQFLASMSHEIRTPLSAMIGYAEVMLAESDAKDTSPQDVNALDTIVRNGKHLLEVINDILDLSKLEAGGIEIEAIPCSPTEVIAEVLRSMRSQADQKSLTLAVRSTTPVPAQVLTDPTCLRRILINLVGNALKFTEKGSVEVVLSFHDDEGSQPLLQFEVVDTGIGISEEQRARLFQPFTQADSSIRRKYGGSGLGLVITKQLSESLGGGVAVESQLGEGSTFRVAIPVDLVDDVTTSVGPVEWGDRTPASNRSEAEPAKTAAKKLDCRILLAEDSVDNQRLISLLLRKAGAEVTMVDNGQLAYEKALEAFHAGTPYDVILTDIQMPVLDGYGATRRLREQGYTLPIIAVTAHAMSGEREKCLAAGCDDYTTKPIQRDVLLETVARHLPSAAPATVAQDAS